LADRYTEIGPRAYAVYCGFLYEWFAQDSWKATQKLTVNYGVRQTITVPYKALWGSQIFFDPALYNPATEPKIDPKSGNVIPGSGNTYDGMVIPGSGWTSNACGPMRALHPSRNSKTSQHPSTTDCKSAGFAGSRMVSRLAFPTRSRRAWITAPTTKT
jgi:hypothetical protein